MAEHRQLRVFCCFKLPGVTATELMPGVTARSVACSTFPGQANSRVRSERSSCIFVGTYGAVSILELGLCFSLSRAFPLSVCGQKANALT